MIQEKKKVYGVYKKDPNKPGAYIFQKIITDLPVVNDSGNRSIRRKRRSPQDDELPMIEATIQSTH